jgi:hypothetical protein
MGNSGPTTFWKSNPTARTHLYVIFFQRRLSKRATNPANWFYIDPNGDRAPVAIPRDLAKVQRRKRLA